MRAERRWQIGRAFQPKPPSVYAGKSSHSALVLLDSVLQEKIQISESPGCKSESCDTEQGVEYLRVDFDPYSPWRVDIVARRMAHGRS